MANSADPDLLAFSESGSTLFGTDDLETWYAVLGTQFLPN